jgi:hypothetical protein
MVLCGGEADGKRTVGYPAADNNGAGSIASAVLNRSSIPALGIWPKHILLMARGESRERVAASRCEMPRRTSVAVICLANFRETDIIPPLKRLSQNPLARQRRGLWDRRYLVKRSRQFLPVQSQVPPLDKAQRYCILRMLAWILHVDPDLIAGKCCDRYHLLPVHKMGEAFMNNAG